MRVPVESVERSSTAMRWRLGCCWLRSDWRQAAMLADSLRAGMTTVRDGLLGGVRLCAGEVRSGTRRRKTAAVIAFHSQASATIHASRGRMR